ELNPMEQLWALVKAQVRCQKFQGAETSETRITDAVYGIYTKHIHNIVKIILKVA
ncbi:hypothetical protein BD770DRAFT_329205, partial [Pilaira anomala]